MQLRATRLTAIASAVKRAFNIRSLFAGGAPGVWYDPSDYGATGTLFQDSAGTTPVTAVEQPVGLMLDKSQGLVLGSELVTNGDFSNGSTGWTQISGTFTFSSGRAIAANSDSIKRLSSTASSMVAGRWYVITWNQYAGAGTGAANWTIPGVWSGTDNFANGGNYVNGEGLKTLYYLAPVSGQFYFYNFEQAVEYDNISVKELPGNHAFQATSASRPVLSARYNLLTKTEQFDDAAWFKSNVTAVNTTATTDPLGGNTADKIAETIAVGSHGVFNSSPLQSTSGVFYTYSVYAKKAERSWLIIDAYTATNAFTWFNLDSGAVGTNASGNTATIENVGNGWFKCSVVRASTSSLVNQFLGVYCSTSNGVNSYLGDGTSGIYIWGGSIVQTAQAPAAYQRVNTATDYATTGFLPYLKFDGVDDSLSTNSINFTSTDKMSVFAGVRKLSDAATAIAVELSASAASNVGAFFVAAPVSAGATYTLLSQGNVLSLATSPSSYASPITNVVTGLGNISGDLATLRINGAQIAQSTADQGTGNYGNYPLYIGRRNNASLPFNGQMYSMIIVGKAVTAGELSSTEKFVASKTGVTL